MLDVVFDSGVKGALKHAMNYNPNGWRKGAMAFVGKKLSDEELEKMFTGQPLGGNKDDVVQLGFFMDVGNIENGVNRNSRKEVFESFYGIMPGHEQERERILDAIFCDYERILKEVIQKTDIRVWIDHSPYSVCGYYYLCDLLRHSKCRLSKVVMPEYWQDEENKMSEGGWNSIQPGKFYKFLQYEKLIPQIEIQEIGTIWKELVKENAPLRAIVNGRLISVPIDFYDHLIDRELPDEPIVMGKLIGKLMLKYSLGISDSWYQLRIKNMIKKGKIDIIAHKDENHPYGAILKKVNK